jgi:hypothetical protein
MFCRRQRERKLHVFFPAKKTQDVRRAMVTGSLASIGIDIILVLVGRYFGRYFEH